MTANQLSSVENALSILKAFTLDEPVLHVKELSERLGIAQSSTSRLVKTLYQQGFLEKDSFSRGYRLGLFSLTLGGIYVNTNEIYSYVSPVLSDIVQETKESAQLAVLNGDSVFYLAQNSGVYYSHITGQIGSRNPIHATSSGKLLLAFETDDRLFDTIVAQGLHAYNDHTITDPLKLKEELQTIREQGYSLNLQELNETNYSVSVPVKNQDGKVCCALTVIAPMSRYSQTKLTSILRTLREAARDASERLGYEY